LYKSGLKYNFLSSLFRLIPQVTLANADDVIGLCEDLLSQKVKTPAMLGFMLTVYEQRLKAGTAKPDTYQNAIEVSFKKFTQKQYSEFGIFSSVISWP
jgi:hypothetical protein